MSPKYPRSLHLPWSLGGTSDDKRAKDVAGLLGVEIVITEKCDGSNLTYTRDAVYARSHAGPPAHRSFDLAKATHARIAHQIPRGLSVFCEYCYAVHSIVYEALPGYSLLFAVRDDEARTFWDWDLTVALAVELNLPTVPLLFRGEVSKEGELVALTERLAKEPSVWGGKREGLVVRLASSFAEADFGKSLAKWVRKDHVQTDEHWTEKTVVAQRLTSR